MPQHQIATTVKQVLSLNQYLSASGKCTTHRCYITVSFEQNTKKQLYISKMRLKICCVRDADVPNIVAGIWGDGSFWDVREWEISASSKICNTTTHYKHNTSGNPQTIETILLWVYQKWWNARRSFLSDTRLHLVILIPDLEMKNCVYHIGFSTHKMEITVWMEHDFLQISFSLAHVWRQSSYDTSIMSEMKCWYGVPVVEAELEIHSI